MDGVRKAEGGEGATGEIAWVPFGVGSVVNQQKWDTLRPEKVIVMRSVGRAP